MQAEAKEEDKEPTLEELVIAAFVIGIYTRTTSVQGVTELSPNQVIEVARTKLHLNAKLEPMANAVVSVYQTLMQLFH
jgi:hypothetical protein